MGCSINATKRKINLNEEKKISSIQDIVVQPALFISQNASKFQDVYRLGSIVGSGHYGEVRTCFHRDTSEFRAVKIIKKHLFKEDFKVSLLSEVAILRSLDHPNIIRIYEFFEDDKRFYIVMEYCSGGDLFGEILKEKNFTETLAAKIMQQIFSALSYMHSKNIMHRDLKPENILIEDKKTGFNIKIIDFGFATYLKGSNISGMVGSLYYMAPEVILGEYSLKADVWSAGTLLYILLSGVAPFTGNNDESIIAKIVSCNFVFPHNIWKHISGSAVNFIKKLLCPAQLRYTAQEALDNLWIDTSEFQSPINHSTLVQVLQNLQTFQTSNKLNEAVRTFITTQCISVKETRILSETFKKIDKNGDGKLSLDELTEMYKETMGEEEALKEAQKIMKQVDTDNNGYIDFTEFLKVSMDTQKIMSLENLKKAFKMFDKDDSGKISAQELKLVLTGSKASDEKVWTDIISQVDFDGDGEIDLAEFQQLILSKV